ncbi:hypothetical protein FRC12_023351 [Ceratobasidium sp. 428]|nr:hypothetical protein FRC12_023351 [Ceratobasidium sp. 428]
MSRQHADADLVSIVLFGCTGVGKSTFINDASRAELSVGHGLATQTKEIQASPVFQVGGRDVQLYDTPGFDDTVLTDMQILNKLANFFEDMEVASTS